MSSQQKILKIVKKQPMPIQITGGSGSGGMLVDYCATDDELKRFYGIK